MLSTNFYIPPLLKIKSKLDLTLSNQIIDFEERLVTPFRIQLHTDKIRTSTVDSDHTENLFFKKDTKERIIKSFVIQQIGYIANFPVF